MTSIPYQPEPGAVVEPPPGSAAAERRRRYMIGATFLAPGQFGSADEWTLLQGFFKNPDDVDGAAAKLEAAAKKAYSGS